MPAALRISGFLCVLSGCVQVLGIQDWGASGTAASTSTNDASASAASTTSGLVACGTTDANVCLAIPPGWLGPVTLGLAETTHCEGTFDVDLWSGETDIVGSDAQCACNCNGPTGGSCGAAKLSWFNDSACTTGVQQTFDIGSACSGALSGAATNALGVSFAEPLVVPGSCSPAPKKVIAPVTSVARHVCGLGNAPDACGPSSACAPKPDTDKEPRLCVWSEGTNACPNAELGFAIPVYRKPPTDDRDCSTCACDLNGETCSATVSVFNASVSCTGAAQTSAGACTGLVTAGFRSAIANVVHAPGTCVAHAPSTPIGSVVGQDPITLCCTLPL